MNSGCFMSYALYLVLSVAVLTGCTKIQSLFNIKSTPKLLLLSGALTNSVVPTVVVAPQSTPCKPHGGPALLGEGSGMCTGNYRTILSLGSAESFLFHDSKASRGAGFGIGFTPAFESWFFFKKDSTTEGVIMEGNGLISYFKKRGADAQFEAVDLEQNRNLLSFPTTTTMKETGPVGIVRTYTKQASGRYTLTTIQDRNGNTTTYARTGARLDMITWPNNQTTKFTYTGTHVTTVKDVVGTGILLEYDLADHVSKVTYPDGTIVSVIFTGEYVTEIKNPFGKVSKIEYDDTGAVNKIISSSGKENKITYTANSVLVETPHSKITESFNSSGKLISTNVDGVEETFERDVQERIISTTDSLGGLTRYEYSGDSNLVSKQTGADGTISTFVYNSLDQVTQMTQVIGAVTVTTSTEYNSLNLVASSTIQGKRTAYVYDSKGNLKTVTDWTGAVVYLATYNTSGQVLTETDGLGLKTTYTYDANDYINSIVASNGKKTTITNDKFGRVLSVVDGYGVKQSAGYAASGQIANTSTSFVVGTKTEKQEQTLTTNTDGTSRATSTWVLDGKSLQNEASEFSDKGSLTRRVRVE